MRKMEAAHILNKKFRLKIQNYVQRKHFITSRNLSSNHYKIWFIDSVFAEQI